MDLYRLTNEALESVPERGFRLERDLQKIVESNLETLFSLEFVCSELRLGRFRLDTVAYDRKKRTFVIIEYKKGGNYSVIDQGYSYLSLMTDHKSDFVLEYKERTNDKLSRTDVDWQKSRILFVAPYFSVYQKKSIEYKDLPFELWQIKRYGDDLVALERHTSSSDESAMLSPKPLEKKGGKPGLLDKSQSSSASRLLGKANEECKKVWEKLKINVEALGEWQVNEKTNYISFRSSSGTLCYVLFRNDHLKIYVRRGHIKDGIKSKKYFTWADPKSFAINHRRHTKGITIDEYIFKVSKIDEIDYVMSLLKQKHAALIN